jgi:hypothetical protein
MNPKFILKENMVIKIPGMTKEIKLFEKGKVFESNENGEYVIDSMGSQNILSIDGMREAVDQEGKVLFDEIKSEVVEQDLDIIVEEIPDDDDEQVKRWRIQLDVTTTRKKLKEIEKFVNDNVKKLL